MIYDIPKIEFFKKFQKASAINKTDDVVWVWCAYDLLKKNKFGMSEWNWLYHMGVECFEKLYNRFYDPNDGLYYGQPSFVDVGGGGYPDGWNNTSIEARNKCVWVKAASTNCLYYKALKSMGKAAEILGLKKEAQEWIRKAEALKKAIKKELCFPEGTLAYFKHRDNHLEDRRDILGSSFAVLCGVAEDDEARKLLKGYPITPYGVPILYPFYERNDTYHNNAMWPFANTFFLLAMEKAYKKDYSYINMHMMLNDVVNGHFAEVRDMQTNQACGAYSQLWSITAFLNVCIRTDMTEISDEAKHTIL